jgi:hypothetical protein
VWNVNVFFIFFDRRGGAKGMGWKEHSDAYILDEARTLKSEHFYDKPRLPQNAKALFGVFLVSFWCLLVSFGVFWYYS